MARLWINSDYSIDGNDLAAEIDVFEIPHGRQDTETLFHSPARPFQGAKGIQYSYVDPLSKASRV